MTTREKKETGSFYTCKSIADYLAEWAIDRRDTVLLEPSFGDGIFIDSAIKRFEKIGNTTPAIYGIEIQEEPYRHYLDGHTNINGFLMDFMGFRPDIHFDAIIGNPPYVSLKNLQASDREKALQTISSYGLQMQTSGSLWMPFIIHATELLRENGKLGFVLPYEITYVRYAFPLWKYLSKNYGHITICRIFHDFFPNVDVETILFLAEQKGSTTNSVSYHTYNTIDDLLSGKCCSKTDCFIDDIVSMQKPFERNLLPKTTFSFLQNLRNINALVPFVNDCKFKIGFVSGSKHYFTLTTHDINRLKIHSINVKKCLTNAKQINANKQVGIETQAISEYSYLFYPVCIYEEEKQYINTGEVQGINKGYKCRVRNPWYLTPDIEVPDIILTVFGNTPKLLINNGGFVASNSLLCGVSKVENVKELACRWYNSLTLLSIELSIHSLGGGTLVLIPGETDKLEIVSNFPPEKVETTYSSLSCFARNHSVDEIYNYGDSIVLKDVYGLSDSDICDIRQSLSILRKWRNPDKRRG